VLPSSPTHGTMSLCTARGGARSSTERREVTRRFVKRQGFVLSGVSWGILTQLQGSARGVVGCPTGAGARTGTSDVNYVLTFWSSPSPAAWVYYAPGATNTGPVLSFNRGSGGRARGCDFEKRAGAYARTEGVVSYSSRCLPVCLCVCRRRSSHCLISQ